MSGRALRFVYEAIRPSKAVRFLWTKLGFRHRPFPAPFGPPHARPKRPHARLAASPPIEPRLAASAGCLVHSGPPPAPHATTL